MTLSMHTDVLDLVFSEPFHIARTEESEAMRTVAVDLDLEGAHGLGECCPLAYYGETPETVAAVLPRLLGALEALGPLPADRGAVLAWLERSALLMTDVLGNHGAAKGGLDMCSPRPRREGPRRARLGAHRHVGPASARPTTRWASTSRPWSPSERAAPPTSRPSRSRSAARPTSRRWRPCAGCTAGPCAWTPTPGGSRSRPRRSSRSWPASAWSSIEQPFPARALPQLRWLRERSSLPILADESAVFEEDLRCSRASWTASSSSSPSAAASGPALRMIRRARQLGMKVMLGCMVESSLGVAAGAMVASEVDWLDLDGNLMLVHDPFDGIELGEDCRWQLTSKPGWIHRV